MPLQYCLLDSTGRLAPYSVSISEAIDTALGVIRPYFVCDIDVCVSYYPNGTNPDMGIGGGSFSPHLLHVFLNTEHPDIARSIDKQMLAVLAHEVHHCVRRSELGDDVTLLDYLITEGLACCFETEVAGVDIPSFIPAKLIHSWSALFADMAPFLRENEFDFDLFFLGKVPDRFPKYAGYAVGYGLARRYAELTQRSCASAVQLASEIVVAGANGQDV